MTTPEKVDEFMTKRAQIEKSSAKKELITAGLTTLVGAVAGCFVKIAKTPVLERVVGGGILGLCTGALAALGIALAADNKTIKLTENFVKENMQ